MKSESIAALCAPKILDEGVDVPNIDLGIVLSASSGRRQMIQRLGRVIRLKEDGGHARFVVVFAEGTVEDPSSSGNELMFVLGNGRGDVAMDSPRRTAGSVPSRPG